MDILIVAHFTQAPNEKGNGRFHYLANLILEKGGKENSVEIVSTSFSHRTKAQRHVNQEELEKLSYKFTMCYESGYTKNVCLKRFYSHYVFGKNLAKYLENRRKPDVIYCAVPSLDAAYVAMKYAKKNKIKFIIDVQDLWPEAFEMVFHIPVLSKLVFAPMKKIADSIYSYADRVIAVSDTYCKRARKVNDKVQNTHTVFLGTELKQFDKNVAKYLIEKNKDEIWLAYCGTLGHSYDLKCVMDAMEILMLQGVSSLRFIVMGDGPLRGEFESYAKAKKIAVDFKGRLEYEKMCGLLASCDIAINAISHRAAQSIINKHADYAAAGIPVISTQENEEYRKLVDGYQMGINCLNGDSNSLANALIELIDNPELRLNMGRNARMCAEEKFDRSCSYKVILDLVNGNERID